MACEIGRFSMTRDKFLWADFIGRQNLPILSTICHAFNKQSEKHGNVPTSPGSSVHATSQHKWLKTGTQVTPS